MAEFPALPLFTDAIMADCHHLTDEEFGRYMRILILMWRSPQCRIPADPQWISKRIKVDALAYAQHIQPILQEFCTADAGWWTQKRLLKEYQYVQALTEKRRKAAASRWKKGDITEKKGKTGVQVDMQSKSTSDAPTPTPTPKTITEVIVRSDVQKPERVSEQVWQDFLKHRKAKKAPVTHTVLEEITSEAAKLGWSIEDALRHMCKRNWQGFEADWVNQKGNRNEGNIRNKSKSERADDILEQHLASKGIAYDKGTRTIKPDPAPELRPIQHIRERS